MASSTNLSPKEIEHPTVISPMNYDELLKRSERQAALAKEMSDKAQRMIECALEMRETRFHFVVP